MKFILGVLVITSMTSNITSTSGTFPLYLIRHLDERGISVGRGILWAVRAVVPPPPRLFSVHDCLGELQTATASGSDGALACEAPLHSPRTLPCQKT